MVNQIFRFDDKEVRTVQKGEDVWFVAKDVCEILGLENVSLAINGRADRKNGGLDEDEKGVANVNTLGGEQELLTINESGLYSLIMTSRKPEAKKFRKWVTSEVLPIIRKTGGYVSHDEQFISQYLPFADESTKQMFKATLETVRKQNEVIENKQKEIEHKENVIFKLVEDVTLYEKRRLISKIIENSSQGKIQERWRMAYDIFTKHNKMNLQYQYEKYKNNYKENKKTDKNLIRVENKLDYIDKVMNQIPELYEIVVKLFETDAIRMIREMMDLTNPNIKFENDSKLDLTN